MNETKLDPSLDLFLKYANDFGFGDTDFEKELIIDVINSSSLELDFFHNECGDHWEYIVNIQEMYFKIHIVTKHSLAIGEGITVENIASFYVRPVIPYQKVGWLDEKDFYSKQDYINDTLRYNKIFN